MGFEYQHGAAVGERRASVEDESAIAARGPRREWAGRKAARGAVGVGWAHNCIGVSGHILASSLMEVLGRIEVHAC
jgi:hypothetical protein